MIVSQIKSFKHCLTQSCQALETVQAICPHPQVLPSAAAPVPPADRLIETGQIQILVVTLFLEAFERLRRSRAMQAQQTPQPRQALQEVSNTAEGMEVDSNGADHVKPFQTTLSRPQGENQPLSLPSPDPALSDFALQQALLHSPQFDGSPNTIFKMKLAHLGFVEGSPPGGQLSQQARVRISGQLVDAE